MEEQGKIIGYDPMTGKPIYEKAEEQPKKIKGYDPMTGQPIYEEDASQPKKIKGYDPMTGQPIYEGEEQPKKITGYDPMTGQPIYGDSQATQQESVAEQPKKSKKKGKLIGGIVAVLVLVAAIAYVGITSGAFLPAYGKVAVATANTFTKSGEFVKALQSFDILLDDKYTVDVKGSMSSAGDFDVALRNSSSKKQMEGKVNISGIPGFDFTAEMDKKEVKVNAPSLYDRILVYDYKDNKDGYLVELAGEDVIHAIDSSLSTVFSKKQQKQQEKEMKKILVDFYKGLTFTPVDKEKYKVNGKDRKCKGYEVRITEDDVNRLLDAVKDWLDENYSEELSSARVSADDVIYEAKREISGMRDVTLTFYIYKNALACLNVTSGSETFSCEFHGGQYRIQNSEYKANGVTLVELYGETKDKVEGLKLRIMGKKVGELTYDAKSGNYDISFDYEGSFYVSGKIKEEDKKVKFTIDNIRVDGDSLDGLSLDVAITKDAKFTKISGDSLNVGDASRYDIEELMDVYKKLIYYL